MYRHYTSLLNPPFMKMNENVRANRRFWFEEPEY
jgi:hypothetical protein